MIREKIKFNRDIVELNLQKIRYFIILIILHQFDDVCGNFYSNE